MSARPFAQFLYNAIALSVIRRSAIAAAIIAVPTPLAAPVAVVYLAAKELLEAHLGP